MAHLRPSLLETALAKTRQLKSVELNGSANRPKPTPPPHPPPLAGKGWGGGIFRHRSNAKTDISDFAVLIECRSWQARLRVENRMPRIKMAHAKSLVAAACVVGG